MRAPDEQLLRRLFALIEEELPRALELRHRLHSHAELSHAELWTAEAVAAELPVAAEPAAATGRLALIGAAERAPVAVRAELDALPMREQTGSPFSATEGAMHACGHDVHMAALVALARACASVREELPAPLLAVFQPSEEAYPSGAQELAVGELARAAPGAVVAAHVHPELPWGSLALDAGVVNASCDAFEVTVEGRPSHGAYPHLGRDPILALAQIVVSLHAQLGMRSDPLSPAVLSVGVIEGGSAENVIPGSARARGALRAYSEPQRRTLRELVAQVSEGVAAASGCSAQVELIAGEPPLENDARIIDAARALLVAGGLELAAPWRSAGSDDFAFFGELAPIAMCFVGLDGAPGFQPRPLHHPELLVPDAALGAVARAQAILYLAAASAVSE